MNSSSSNRIAIIGGGISGLAAAQRIAELQPQAEVTLLEASDRLGGIIQSTQQDGYLFEHAADSFIVSPDLPWAGGLCEKLGLELIETESAHRGASILRNGQLHPVPSGQQLLTIHQFKTMLRSPLLSWRGKLRVLAERFIPGKHDSADESLASFSRRRYGKEMFEQVIQPLVSGIYTADPERLSMLAALPQFARMEREHGSLYRASRQSKQASDVRGARYGLFRSPQDGMQSLIDTCESHLADRGVQIRCSTPVESIEHHQGKWQLAIANQQPETFDGVILATSIQSIARILGEDAPLAKLTDRVEHVGTAIVCLGYKKTQLPPLRSFGSVIPHVEGRKILAVSHTHVKFPSRAPADAALLRAFVGGALQPEVAELENGPLLECVQAELQEIMGVSGNPVTHKIVRWPSTTPQYNLGHCELVADIQKQAEALPRFAIANNAMNGVGIPQCVRGGWRAADSLLARNSNPTA